MKRTATGILCTLAVSFMIGCSCTPQATDSKTVRTYLEALKGYLGKDLSKLDATATEQLLVTITKLLPNRTYREYFDFRPWHVWEFPNGGQPLVVLFEVDNTRPHPGQTGIRITVFDASGNIQSETAFGTGHRSYMSGVTLQNLIKGEDPIIVLETGGLGGPDSKQYYARIGGRFDLVRLENTEGTATRNRYYINHFKCGPEIVRQSQAEWEADLLSGGRLQLLRALEWLGAHTGNSRRGTRPTSKSRISTRSI